MEGVVSGCEAMVGGAEEPSEQAWEPSSEVEEKSDGRRNNGNRNKHIITDHPPSEFTYQLGCRCLQCLKQHKRETNRIRYHRIEKDLRIVRKKQAIGVPTVDLAAMTGLPDGVQRLWVVQCRDERTWPMKSLREAMKVRDMWNESEFNGALRCRRKHVIRAIYAKRRADGNVWWSFDPMKFTKIIDDKIEFGYIGHQRLGARAEMEVGE